MATKDTGIRALLDKRASGEPLTDDERRTLRDYYRRYDRDRCHVHIGHERLAAWREAAKAQGWGCRCGSWTRSSGRAAASMRRSPA